ncbi:hypothetical protein ACK31E_03880 [Aeromonas caviae]
MTKLLHPVVIAAVDKLAKSLSPQSGILHPIDRSKAIGLFYALLDKRYSYEHHHIFDRLVEHGWSVERAGEVADLAELCSVDGYVKEDPPLGWGERVVKNIISELAEDNA